MRRSIGLLLALGLLAGWPASARAQFPSRPWLDWRTIETEHFAVHAPPELEDWARHAAARLESVRAEVQAMVGYAPPGRVQVVVDDPYGQANGSAWPMLDFPMMVLWPVAPSPRSAIGNYADWSALLTIHEYAHLAHLTRPTRNAWWRFLWSHGPVPIGPVARKAPRWVFEGYATVVEGRLTGMGRPYGAYRAAILRQWAIEGTLPTYGQLNASGAFLGGNFAYLAGSAYLEWLTRRQGDSSLLHLWRRLSARVNRTFPQAFAGVYGRSPEALYARFAAEVTHDALEVERAVDAAGGPVQGTLVQRLAWATGDPAISPDGEQVALSLARGNGPRRLVVIPTAEQPDTMRAKARARLLARDPLDVPDSQFYPAPRRPLATLPARDGLPFVEPRWMPGGRELLVSRATPRADGTQRSDLYLWRWQDGDLRRVTHGAGVRQPDPSPDGRRAVATRCTGGTCDVVLVDLATGAVRTLLAGSAGVVYDHPRFAPDGARIVVAMLDAGRWRVALSDTTGRAPRAIDPDDGAHRYDPAWADSGRAVLAVSERGGIMNLERIWVRDAAAPAAARTLTLTLTLTRVTGAAVAPEQHPRDGSVWFLALHSQGFDLRRLASDTAGVALPVLPDSLVPVVPRRAAFVPPTLAVESLPPAHAYGVGPRQRRTIPLVSTGADGTALGWAVNGSDPIGRLSASLVGQVGRDAAWTGARAAVAWRGWRPVLGAELFAAKQSSVSDTRIGGGMLTMHIDDARPAGWSLGTSLSFAQARHGRWIDTTDIEGMPARLHDDQRFTRPMLSVDAGFHHDRAVDRWGTIFRARAHGDAGRDAGTAFTRVTGSIMAGLRGPMIPGLLVTGAAGAMRGDAPFEQFQVRGLRPLVVNDALVPQWLAHPALREGMARGRQFVQLRASTPLGPVEPFYWITGVGDRRTASQWARVYGVEIRGSTPPMHLLAVPALSVQVGVGRSVEEKKTRFYLGTTIAP